MIERRHRVASSPQGFTRASVLVCAVVLTLVASSATGATDADDLTPEDRIIAAFVYNFCKVVDWPDESGDQLTLVVIGDDGAASALMEIDGRIVGHRTLRVFNLEPDAAIDGCQLLYISPTSDATVTSLFERLGSSPTLTISTIEDFCHQGGMIQMKRNRGKIRLLINNQRARASRLQLSSQLLKIATVFND